MSEIFGYGRGGKHRNTEHASRWRTTTTQIADQLQQTGTIRDRDIALMQAEDLLASAIRTMKQESS